MVSADPTLTVLLPVIGLGQTSALVAGRSLLGLLVTVMLLPEPTGLSLETLTAAGPAPAAASGVRARR